MATERNLIDKKLLKFLLVGVFNTLLGLALSFTFYQVLTLGYWPSTALSTAIGMVFSFFLNRNFTFGHNGNALPSFVKFTMGQVLCYIIAYKVAQPLVKSLLNMPPFAHLGGYAGQLSILAGMCLFTLINYLTQRLFVFRER
jgi:putative flippase GtrA